MGALPGGSAGFCVVGGSDAPEMRVKILVEKILENENQTQYGSAMLSSYGVMAGREALWVAGQGVAPVRRRCIGRFAPCGPVIESEKEYVMSRLRMVGMLNRAGMTAFNEGRTADALFQLVQADRLARSLELPLHEAKVRNNIGLVHQGTGNRDEALACFRLAARYAVKGAGEGNVLHKTIVKNLTRLKAEVVEQAA